MIDQRTHFVSSVLDFKAVQGNEASIGIST